MSATAASYAAVQLATQFRLGLTSLPKTTRMDFEVGLGLAHVEFPRTSLQKRPREWNVSLSQGASFALSIAASVSAGEDIRFRV